MMSSLTTHYMFCFNSKLRRGDPFTDSTLFGQESLTSNRKSESKCLHFMIFSHWPTIWCPIQNVTLKSGPCCKTVPNLQNRRDILRGLGQQRREKSKREARVAREGNSAKKKTRSSSRARLALAAHLVFAFARLKYVKNHASSAGEPVK